MERFGEVTASTRCSFCGVSQRSTKKLIAGPSVCICDQCVDLCCEIMMDEGVFDPRQRYADFDAETYLYNWIDSIDPEDTQRSKEARKLLHELLSRLPPKTVEEAQISDSVICRYLDPEDP